MTGLQKPTWSQWGLMRTAETWQAIALSLDVQPDALMDTCGKKDLWWVDNKSEPFKLYRDYILRANVLIENLPANNVPRRSGYLKRACVLAWMAQHCVTYGWDIPDEFRALAGPIPPETRPELAPEAETHPAIKKEGYVFKKAALVKKHSASWPTIDADFNHASENGLSKAAKAPTHGDWYQSAALEWAAQRGKMTTPTEQHLVNSAFALSRNIHKTRG